MDWFEELRERLFGQEVHRTGHLHHGPLVRSLAFAKRHAAWKEAGTCTRQLDELRQLLLQEEQNGDSPGFHLLRDAKATGMQLARPQHWPADSLAHVLDEFRDQLLERGYRAQLSDLRISVQGLHRERHFLKPATAPSTPGGLLDQRYGNILLEAWGPAEGAMHLKVLATVYNDRLYSAPLPGMELLSALVTLGGRPFN